MGLFNFNNEDMGKNKILKKIRSKLALATAFFIAKLLPLILATGILFVAVDYLVEIVTSKNIPQKITQILEVDDVSKLIEIKQNEQGEYYLGFIDGIDDKLDDVIDQINSQAGVHNLPGSRDFLKKLIKAEVVTKYPDLGGEIPEGSDGFQGAVKIRRISPNKEIGKITNVGRGETSAIENDIIYDTQTKSDYEEIINKWETGKKLKIKYDAIVYKQTESKLNPGSDTGNWEAVYNEKVSGNLKIKSGTEVEYTGTYKNSTNPLTNETITYVEVENKKDNVRGFVKAQFLTDKNEENDNKKTSKVNTNKKSVTSREKQKTKEYIGNQDESYKVAIAAGHNDTDNTGASNGELVEQKLTIKVAEKVQELIEEKYSNIEVVQTGSTSSNTGGIKVEERKELAKRENPDLCIQIHFNSGGGSGVETIYKEGDGVSQQLAEILSDEISKSMELDNRQAGPDSEKCANQNLGIIENAATSGFPSVVTEGGFLDGSPDADIIKNDGIEKYAKGIVEGIKRYIESDHSGYSSSVVNNQTVSDSIESIVRNLKYVPLETMKKDIEEGKEEALKEFTIDESGKILTATWELGEKKSIKENATIDLATALQNYVVPYEYLLYFYIDTDYTGFSEDLAEEILKSEIVLAVQDNVTTTKEKKQVFEKKTTTESKDTQNKHSYNWKSIDKKETTTEVCSTKVEITYVNTWCVKLYKENSYSSKALEMGDSNEKIINIKGTVTDTPSNSLTAAKIKETGRVEKEDGKGIDYSYKIYQREQTDTETLVSSYSSEDFKEAKGQEGKFVDLYKKNKMYQKLREQYLFQIISNNEKTANLLDLTKYLIFKATGESYGVDEYDFGIYKISSFSSMTGLYGNSIQENVWFALRGAGYSEIASAAVMGNIQRESEFDASKIEKANGVGFGLCQWSYGRRTNLENYAVSKGIEPSDLQTQIEFLLAEINPSGGANGFASYQMGSASSTKYDGNKYTQSDWENATDIDVATMAFMAVFERPSYDPSINHIASRREWARKYLEEFKGRTAPTADERIGAITLSGDNANKMMQMLVEALRIADDDRYSYSQANRNDEFQYDCSSFVARLYKQYFGFSAPNDTRAYNEQWKVGPVGSVELQPGDVLWRSGHVEMYIGNGLIVGAHGSDNKPIPDQISVISYKPSSWTYVYRFIR